MLVMAGRIQSSDQLYGASEIGERADMNIQPERQAGRGKVFIAPFDERPVDAHDVCPEDTRDFDREVGLARAAVAADE